MPRWLNNASIWRRKIHALIFLVTPEEQPLLHMRIIGHMAELIEAEEFLDRWVSAKNERSLKEVL